MPEHSSDYTTQRVISKKALLVMWDASTSDRLPKSRLLAFLNVNTSSETIKKILRALYVATLPSRTLDMVRLRGHNGLIHPKFISYNGTHRFGDNPWIIVYPVENIRIKWRNSSSEFVYWETTSYPPLQTSTLVCLDQDKRLYRFLRCL